MSCLIRYRKGKGMHDPKDVVSLGVGAVTAGVGLTGLTAEDVQVILSIVASISGIVLTVATLWWRRGENRRRVREFKDYEKRIERLEDARKDFGEDEDHESK